MKSTGKAHVIPLDGPKRLRAITADVEKQEAVVEAFRVSLFLVPPTLGGFVDGAERG